MSTAVDTGAVPGFTLELVAAYAKSGTGPGVNSPLTTDWNDDSGNGHDGTLTNFGATSPWGGVGSKASPYCLALASASSERVALSKLNVCDTNVFSYEAWVKASSAPSAVEHIINEYGSAYYCCLRIDTSGYPSFTMNRASQAIGAYSANICDGNWHHIVGTCDGTNKRLYVDGVLRSGPTTIPTGSQTSTYAAVGCEQSGASSYTAYFNGSLAVARVYPFALSQAQVTQNYNAGIPTVQVTGAGAGALQIAGAESGATVVKQAQTGTGAGAEQVAGAESGATLVHQAKAGAGAGALQVSGVPQAALRAFGAAVFGTGAVTVPKPAGLTAGDTIVLGLFWNHGDTPTFPDGFTNVLENTVYDFSLATLTREATAADVAGSGWAVSVTGGGTVAGVAGAFTDTNIAGILATSRSGEFDGFDLETSGTPPLWTAVIIAAITGDGGTGELTNPQIFDHEDAVWAKEVDAGTGNTGVKTSLTAWVAAPQDYSDEQGTDDWTVTWTGGSPSGHSCAMIGLLLPAILPGEAVTQAKTGSGAGADQVAGAESGATLVKQVVTGSGAGSLQIAASEVGARAVVRGGGDGYLQIAGASSDRPAYPAPIPFAVPAPACTAAVATTPSVVPPAVPPVGSGLDVILTRGSSVVHIGSSCEKTVTSRARKYGFEKASFELPDHLVTSWYDELQLGTDVQIIRDGLTCFEGRLTDPGVSVGSDDHRRLVGARGYADALADNESARACFADSDFSDWRRPTKTAKHDFNIDSTTSNTGVIGAGNITAQAKFGSTYASDAWGALCWWLYDGIPTPDKIAGIEVTWHWNGKLDPNLILTSKLPIYNLFADPRGMNGSNPWTRTKDNVYTTNGYDADNDLSATVPKVVCGYEALSMAGANPAFGNADANCFTFVAADQGVPAIGVPVWGHKMALSSDIKKRLAAGDAIPLSAGWWVAAFTQGAGTDSAMIYIYDKAGNVLQTQTLYTELDDFSGAWAWYGGTIDQLDAAACNVEIYISWQTESTVRKLCFPMVSNTTDPTYYDGDSGGWEWTSTMNNSPSRETDLTVTEGVLDEYAGLNNGCIPLNVYLIASDDPANEVAPFYPIKIWDKPRYNSGHLSVTLEHPTSALAIWILLEGCDYALTFKAPDSGTTPECYGLTISSYTVYGAFMGAEGVSVLECVTSAAMRAVGAPSEKLDIPGDTGDVVASQLNYPQATTWADIISNLDALLDWEYGFRENGTFYYEDPAAIAADQRCIYQIPNAKATASLAVSMDDVCNGVEVTWTHADGVTPGSVLVTRQSPYLPDGLERIHHVDAPSEATYADALALANAYLDEHIKPQVTGSLPLTVAQVQDGNGAWHDVMTIREGEYCRLVDAPPEEQDYGLLLISRVTIDHDNMQVTLEVGMNRKRLDRLLARLDAKVVRR